MSAVGSKDLTVLSQLLAVRFIFLPGDVTRMGITEEKRPFFLRDRLDLHRAIQPFGRMGTPIAERSCIARITQHFEHAIVNEGCPVDLACMGTCTDTTRKEQPLFTEMLDGRPC